MQLFDHVNAILVNKSISHFDLLTEVDRKTYNTYMINRILSMHIDFLPIINLNQLYSNLSSRESYIFLNTVLPKGKRYAKYLKASDEEKFNSDLIDIIRKYYTVKWAEALEYLEIFASSNEGIEELTSICKLYGNDDKKIKKLLKGVNNVGK